MTRFTKIAAATTAALGLTLLAGFGFAGPHRGHCDADPEKAARFTTYMVNDALDEVDASDEQRSRILEIKDELLDEGLALKASHGDVKAEVQAQWLSDNPDSEALHGMVDARVAEMTDFAHKAVDAVVEIHSLLTPEQRSELLEMHEERHAEGGHWRR